MGSKVKFLNFAITKSVVNIFTEILHADGVTLDMKHINRNFRWNALSDPNEGGGVGLKFIFSEYGHVAYQIKGNDACSNMAVYILPVDTPTAHGLGQK